jgi:hypothetical protein
MYAIIDGCSQAAANPAKMVGVQLTAFSSIKQRSICCLSGIVSF